MRLEIPAPRAAFMLATLMALASGFVSPSNAAEADPGRRVALLASDKGCTLCHRGEPAARGSNGAMPLAPSWREIAARYRGEAGAEERLTLIVIGGADPGDHHWKDRLDFTAMRGNQSSLTAQEARALVRWILASP